jgi:uncharacterized membrane protein YedE/YeeE
MTVLLQFAIGLLFGSGLVLSGMSNPAKVLNFLDLGGIPGGTWDPSLAFVMAGAVTVAFIGFRLVLRRAAPILDDRFHLSDRRGIDSRLILGPAIFGIGWGLVGFCPGPAVTSLGFGSPRGLLFVAAMLVGMGLARWLWLRGWSPRPA